MEADSPVVLVNGRGSLVTGDDGQVAIDLVMGFGAAFLGHGHPAVTDALCEQLRAGLWSCGRWRTAAHELADAAIAALLPRGMYCAGLYSTGMEVAEFALRIAATHTGRSAFAGFAQSMHGKSAMTAALCWANAPVRPEQLHMLPFVSQTDEAGVLAALEAVLRSREVAALLVEPIQGSNAAHEGSTELCDRIVAMCRAHGTLCIFDEVLTGLFRTGPAFYATALRQPPDMLLFGKSMGNGFPVSALALGDAIDVPPQALPGSTFSGNPLAAAAVAATLAAMSALDMPRRVAGIESVVRERLGGGSAAGWRLRGRGALWCIELDTRVRVPQALARIRQQGVLVAASGRVLRLLPAATIAPELLAQACDVIAQACIEAGE